MSQVPGTGTWLKAPDIKEGDTAKIISEAIWEESSFENSDGSKKNQYVCMVNHNGEERKLKLTMKSCENISPVYGKDSMDWIGKEIKLTVKEIEVGGKDRQTVRAFPIGGPAVETPVEAKKGSSKEAWDE